MLLREIFSREDLPVPAGIRRVRTVLKFAACFAGGMFYAASLPPFNLTILAAVCQLPLLFHLKRAGWKSAAAAGWVWSLGWSLFSFRFLREIDPAVPFLLAPVVSLWAAVFAGMIPFLRDHTLVRKGTKVADSQPFGRLLLFSAGTAALFVLVEWTRSRLFTWNDFSVTLWRVPVLLQIAVLTGHYGVNFLVALANAAVAALAVYRSWGVSLVLSCVILLAAVAGFLRLADLPPQKTITFSPALIQGNLSQRRHASLARAREALETYVNATEKLLERGKKPDIVLWPESAVPLTFYSKYDLEYTLQRSEYGRLTAEYQRRVKELCRKWRLPLYIGALDLEDTFSPSGKAGATNSALLIDEKGVVRAKYDKLHRVPFGEYIPFRSLLPGFVIRRIDMGRDLTPGRNADPVNVLPQVRAGTAICYEGVFSYVMRRFAARGANVFIVLSNDAWYPRSSEPEQHLANAVLRAVETGLPMIRCGNNGGSGVVYPDGTFRIVDPTGRHPRPELLRCAAAEIVSVAIPADPPRTFYVRYGEWFILLLALGIAGWAVSAAANFVSGRRALAARLLPGENQNDQERNDP